jgi:hypothetical protein
VRFRPLYDSVVVVAVKTNGIIGRGSTSVPVYTSTMSSQRSGKSPAEATAAEALQALVSPVHFAAGISLGASTHEQLASESNVVRAPPASLSRSSRGSSECAVGGGADVLDKVAESSSNESRNVARGRTPPAVQSSVAQAPRQRGTADAEDSMPDTAVSAENVTSCNESNSCNANSCTPPEV